MKTNEQELTPWFPANQPPIRIGIYECERMEIAGRVIRFLRWTGTGWVYVIKAGICNPGSYAHMSIFDNDKWRGITKEPK